MHPLSPFHFCPVCGSPQFVENNVKSKRCLHCGFIYYANAYSATAAFIVSNGRLLVATRANDPAKGSCDLPGGFVDMDETGEEGMRREIMEETGLDSQEVEYLFSIPNLYEYSGMVIHTLDMFYKVEVGADAQPQASDDAATLRWVPLDEVRPEDFGLQSVRQAVTRFITRNAQ